MVLCLGLDKMLREPMHPKTSLDPFCVFVYFCGQSAQRIAKRKAKIQDTCEYGRGNLPN